MVLSHWVGQDLQTCSEDRYWGAGESRAMHCTRASIYAELPVNCLSFWVMQSAQPKLPRTHVQGHSWRG